MVLDWVQYQAETGDYDVTFERDDELGRAGREPPKLYRYELQGPTRRPLIEKLTGAPLPDVVLPHDGLHDRGPRRAVAAPRHGRPAGLRAVRAVGTKASDVRAAFSRRARDLGLVRVGAKAYSSANLESAWVPSPLPAIFGEGTAGVP